MKLLLVNGNTTQAVTDRVVVEAKRCASAGTAITGVTARFGVSIVSTEAEEGSRATPCWTRLRLTLPGTMLPSWRSRSIRRCWGHGRSCRSR